MARISAHKVVIINHSGKGGVDAQGGAYSQTNLYRPDLPQIPDRLYLEKVERS